MRLYNDFEGLQIQINDDSLVGFLFSPMYLTFFYDTEISDMATVVQPSASKLKIQHSFEENNFMTKNTRLNQVTEDHSQDTVSLSLDSRVQQFLQLGYANPLMVA